LLEFTAVTTFHDAWAAGKNRHSDSWKSTVEDGLLRSLMKIAELTEADL
jgi:hypothetical protein